MSSSSDNRASVAAAPLLNEEKALQVAQPSFWGRITSSASSVGGGISSMVVSTVNVGSNAVGALTSAVGNVASAGINMISDVANASVDLAQQSATLVMDVSKVSVPFVRAFGSMERARQSVAAPLSVAINIAAKDMPAIVTNFRVFLLGKKIKRQERLPWQENILELPVVNILKSVETQIAWHQRTRNRQIAKTLLNRKMKAVLHKISLAIHELRILQSHLQEISSQLKLGQERADLFQQKYQSVQSIAEYLTSVSQKINVLIPGVNNLSNESLQRLLDSSAGTVALRHEGFEQFHLALDKLLNVLQVAEHNYVIDNVIDRLHQVTVFSDTIDALSEAVSQYNMHAFLSRWGIAMGVSGAAILNNQIEGYWQETFSVGEGHALLQPGLLYYVSYLNLALSTASLGSGIYHARLLSLSQAKNDFNHLYSVLDQMFRQQVAAAMQVALRGSVDANNWQGESLAVRSKMYLFLRRNLVADKEGLQDILQNTLLNLAIKTAEDQANNMSGPFGSAVGALTWNLLVPFDSYQQSTAGVCAPTSSWHLSSIYRLLANIVGIRASGEANFAQFEQTGGLENCSMNYLAEYQIIAPILYLIEMQLYKQFIAKKIIPFLVGQYAKYNAHTTLTTLSANDALAARIQLSVDEALKNFMFNAGEEPVPAAQQSVKMNVLLEGMLGVATKGIVQGLRKACDDMGAAQFNIQQITESPKRLSDAQRIYGATINALIKIPGRWFFASANRGGNLAAVSSQVLPAGLSARH